MNLIQQTLSRGLLLSCWIMFCSGIGFSQGIDWHKSDAETMMERLIIKTFSIFRTGGISPEILLNRLNLPGRFREMMFIVWKAMSALEHKALP